MHPRPYYLSTNCTINNVCWLMFSDCCFWLGPAALVFLFLVTDHRPHNPLTTSFWYKAGASSTQKPQFKGILRSLRDVRYHWCWKCSHIVPARECISTPSLVLLACISAFFLVSCIPRLISFTSHVDRYLICFMSRLRSCLNPQPAQAVS